MLLPALAHSPPRATVRFGARTIGFADLAAAGLTLASRIPAGAHVAIIVEPRIETAVALVATLAAGAVVVPVNPGAVEDEIAHLVADSRPALVLHGPDTKVPDGLADIEPIAVAVDIEPIAVDADADAPTAATVTSPADPDRTAREPAPEKPAFIMYTSGTTGPPKGAVLSRGAVAANIDALAAAWAWTADDVLVHALPLYHVHGLILGLVGPLRVGASLHHTGRFDPSATADALRTGGTMVFGVPTTYRRLADAADSDPAVADGLRAARLLVSGSAGLPISVHRRIEALTGHVIVERYGMTETIITTAVPFGVRTKAGTVGRPLDDVELRLVGDDGIDIPRHGDTDGDTDDDADTSADAMGEILVRTPSMFSGYLGRPEATEAGYRDGWFVTGDMATRDAEGYLRIVGRRSTDIIKSGGFKIGAGEIEDVLLQHPALSDVAVKGIDDDDLGERVTAWIVVRPGATVTIDELHAHAGEHLAKHKRPRDFVVTDELPRNAMGKVQKSRLEVPPAETRTRITGPNRSARMDP